jgi:ribosomal protein S18 acetylase RimI-like enzyme
VTAEREASPDLEVRDATDDDLGGIARLHVHAFPDSVLGRLGVEAVRRNYRWQLDGPHDVTAIVAGAGGAVEGFLFGGVFRGSTIGFVKREKWFLAGRVLRHPSIVAGRLGRDRLALAGRLLSTRWTAPTPEDPDAVPRRSFGVLAIAVDPASQGRGVGRALMDEARTRAVRAGFEAMHLSVHPDNARAIAFYRSLGWVSTEGPEAPVSARMTIALGGQGGDELTPGDGGGPG